MEASQQKICETQIHNETALRKGHFFEYEQIVKLGAIICMNAGCEPDPARIKDCKRLLKQKVGFFSNFRGLLQYVVHIKMALAEDPEAYFDGVMAVYQRLKSGRKLPGELLAMAAMTIYDYCPTEMLDGVIDTTREAYMRVKERHRFLTDESDMAIIALMVLAAKDPDQVVAQAEELFTALKNRYRIESDAAQTAAMVLAFSDKPVEQKIIDFVNLYEALKTTGHATSKDKEMAIYAAFADIDVERSKVISEIAEVDEWLKGQKGYGVLGTGASMRRLFAATFVLFNRQGDASTAAAHATSAVVQAIVEELVILLVVLIVVAVAAGSTMGSSH